MLDPKEEELLKHTYEIEKENNEMLRTMYSDMWWGRIFKAIYWCVLIALMFGAYYYIQPYIGSFLEKYNAASKVLGSFGK